MSLLLRLFAFPSAGLLKTTPPDRDARRAGLDAAVAWFNASMTEGVPASGYSMISECFMPPSVEVTALWLRFIVRNADASWLPAYDEKAATLARWLTGQQRNDGTWPAGSLDLANAAPGVFASSVALSALVDYREAGGGDRLLLEAIRNNMSWLTRMQDDEGIYRHYLFHDPGGCSWSAVALARAGSLLQDEHALAAAGKTAKHLMALTADGDMAEPGDRAAAFSSWSYAWTMLALFGYGTLSGSDEALRRSREGLDRLARLQVRTGFMPGTVRPGGLASHPFGIPYANCLLALLALAWHGHDAGSGGRGIAERSLRQVLRRQLRSRDPRMRGGLTGSWPVSGNYKPYVIPGEAVAVFAMALSAAAGGEHSV